jgi:hypothetical protein
MVRAGFVIGVINLEGSMKQVLGENENDALNRVAWVPASN